MSSRYPPGTGLDIRRSSDSGRAGGLHTLAGDRSRCEPKEIVMNPVRQIRRIAGVLAGACALLAVAAASPALAARIPDPAPWVGVPEPYRGPTFPRPRSRPDPRRDPHRRGGGMPGWQITLIAVGAALLAAVMAVLADRARAARRPDRHGRLSHARRPDGTARRPGPGCRSGGSQTSRSKRTWPRWKAGSLPGHPADGTPARAWCAGRSSTTGIPALAGSRSAWPAGRCARGCG